MIDAKEFGKALQGGGGLVEQLERALVECYGESADLRYQRARYSAALASFSEAFPDARKLLLVRAPGRVNLIGEHTDYNGLPVLPMAIERDVLVLLSPRKDRRINLVNTSFWYPPRSFELSKRIRPYAQGNWGNYAKAAAQALQEVSPAPLRGFDACISGDIPVGSGLSSSSALVVAVGAALVAANGLSIDPRDLADVLARGERYVGTEGGGMDHAASLLAERGKALVIDFFPLGASPVSLPADHSFIVCNSLVAAEKTGAARAAYNRRVVECRLGVALLSSAMSDHPRRARDLTMLAGLRNWSASRQAAAVEQLPDGAMPLRDVARLVKMPVSTLRESALRLKNGEMAKEPREGFKIKQRVRHVLSEGRRVQQAVRALEAGDSKRFGSLMNESHDSCAHDYEISVPELDALVAICREAGALGARLTGAGFGGCVVAMVRDSDLPEFISAVIARYYHDYLPRERKEAPISVMALEDAIFPCKPCAGAGVLF